MRLPVYSALPIPVIFVAAGEVCRRIRNDPLPAYPEHGISTRASVYSGFSLCFLGYLVGLLEFWFKKVGPYSGSISTLGKAFFGDELVFLQGGRGLVEREVEQGDAALRLLGVKDEMPGGQLKTLR